MKKSQSDTSDSQPAEWLSKSLAAHGLEVQERVEIIKSLLSDRKHRISQMRQAVLQFESSLRKLNQVKFLEI